MEVKYILLLIIVILIGIIIYLIEQLKKAKEENNILMSNIKMAKNREEDYRRENERLNWTMEIKKRTKKETPKEQYTSNKNLKVLIGDYNKLTVTNTNLVIESLGLETDIVQSGEDIIERIQDGAKYDVIITNNVYRGHLGGPNVLDKLKAMENFDTPVIILTVDQDKRDYYINSCGFDEYIPKPLDMEKAQTALKNVIPGLKFKKIKSNKS